MIHEIFPTPIKIVDLSSELEGLYDIVMNQTFAIHGLVSSGVSSYRTNNSILDMKEFHTIKKLLQSEVDELSIALGVEKNSIGNSWCNIMNEGGEVKSHNHPCSVISGALYINADENAGAFNIENPMLCHHMMYDLERETDYTRSYISIEARTGILILFPSFLKHWVTNNLQKNRMVLSFNTNYF